MQLSDNILQNPNVVTRVIDKEAILVNYENKEVFQLNLTSTFLWNSLSKSTQIESLIKNFQKKYSISLQLARKDVMKFISNLLKQHFIIFSQEKGSLKNSPPSFSDKLWDKLQPLAEKRKIPVLVEIELTDKCNLSCIHCYVAKERVPSLSFQEIKDIIDQLKQAGCFFITFTGGEPFLHKDILAIIRYTRSKGIGVDILSNATLITPRIASKLAKMKVNRIQVSIYSANPNIHDSITSTEGSLEKSKEGIRLLRKNGIKVHLSCLVMSLNFLTYKTVGEMAEAMKVSWSVAYPVRARHGGSKDTYRLRLSQRQLEQFTTDNKKEICQRFKKEKDKPICHAGSAICFISASGDITPCVLFPLKVGNLRKQKFIEVWKNSFSLNNFRALTISDIPKCYNCKSLEFCRVCPGLNYLEEGNILIPAKINCQLAQIVRLTFDKKTNKHRK